MAILTLSQLEGHLWKAADILRGAIDPQTINIISFGYFSISAYVIWEKEYEERLKKYGDVEHAADPDEHRFDIPKGRPDLHSSVTSPTFGSTNVFGGSIERDFSRPG